MKKTLKLALIIVALTAVALFSYRAGEARQTALQVCVDAPAAQRTRVINAFTSAYSYPVTVKDAGGADIPNPQTRAAFMKAKLAEYVRETVKAYEVSAAADAARTAAAAKVDSETGIQ